MLSIAQEDPRQAELARLFHEADAFSRSLYPDEGRHPADAASLVRPGVQFFVARLRGTAAGCCALVAEDGTGELKRMVVLPEARKQGVGRALVGAVEWAGRQAGLQCIRLETGPLNREALSLYHYSGYAGRGPFGSYRASPHSVFMEKQLA